MTLNDFIEEQLKDPKFKKEWENSEKDFKETVAEIEKEDRLEVSGLYRSCIGMYKSTV